jgi:predicted permease
MLPAAAAFAIFSTVAFALGPSWSLSRPTVVSDLKDERGSERRRFATGSLLVISQVAVSLALVAAGGLFVRAAIHAAQADPGFSLDHQLMVSLDPSMAGYDRTHTKGLYRTALERVRSVPGVERASFASIVPFGEFREGRTVRLLPGADGVGADFFIVGSDYFATIGMPLLRGREFTAGEGDPAGDLSGVIPIVIDRILSKRLFADADPLGRQLLVQAREGDQAKPFVVIGLVGAMRHDLFDTQTQGHVFAPYAGVFRASMTLHIRTVPGADATAMLATVRRELQQIDERLPIVTARTMIEHRDRSLTEWSVRAAATIFSAFGALALLLATIGVYGLKAYDVSRRTREIGIRMALGATAASVQRLVLREGMRTTAIGLVIGLLMAAGLGKLVSGLLYRVSPFDPVVLAAASVVLCVAAMLASYIPARRATRVVPLEALRSE